MRIKKIKINNRKYTKLKLSALLIITVLTTLLSLPEHRQVNSKNPDFGIGEETEVLIKESPPPEIEEDPRIVQTLEGLPIEEKQRLIASLFRLYNYSEEDIKTWLEIAKLESGYDEFKTPLYSEVRHCRRPDGTYYAVELTQNQAGMWVQATCKTGDIQSYAEKSYGLFQILPSTKNAYGCPSLDKWYEQVECSVRIQLKSGWGAWSTYSLVNK